ncbi:MAG: 4Fe-4S binding protein [Deltaproteobacteria bacterium]|jgi:ferredoxin/flavodoxin|nr:4Fe-4S binding protein [Deltaproteobacteria bacterium]
MAQKSILIVYFSATNVTKMYAEAISKQLIQNDCRIKMINITDYRSRQKQISFEPYDGVIFGFPVFSDFAPSVINDWLPKLEGRDKDCAMFFTYGGRSVGYAHFHTLVLLEKASFNILLSAEFLGRHSFNVAGWDLAADRPNQDDFKVARDFGDQFLKTLNQPEAKSLELQKPFGYDKVLAYQSQQKPAEQPGLYHPVYIDENCAGCGICEKECPTQAIQAENGLTNHQLCIVCMRCVFNCPDQALVAGKQDKDHFLKFFQNYRLTKEMVNRKQSKIITKPWHTVQ